MRLQRVCAASFLVLIAVIAADRLSTVLGVTVFLTAWAILTALASRGQAYRVLSRVSAASRPARTSQLIALCARDTGRLFGPLGMRSPWILAGLARLIVVSWLLVTVVSILYNLAGNHRPAAWHDWLPYWTTYVVAVVAHAIAFSMAGAVAKCRGGELTRLAWMSAVLCLLAPVTLGVAEYAEMRAVQQRAFATGSMQRGHEAWVRYHHRVKSGWSIELRGPSLAESIRLGFVSYVRPLRLVEAGPMKVVQFRASEAFPGIELKTGSTSVMVSGGAWLSSATTLLPLLCFFLATVSLAATQVLVLTVFSILRSPNQLMQRLHENRTVAWLLTNGLVAAAVAIGLLFRSLRSWS